MAAQRFDRGSKEFAMFMDFWAICQKYWIPDDSPNYWDDAVQECRSFSEKYGTGFASRLSIALIRDLEEKQRG